MKASETTLGELLQGQCQYGVPLYQRPYSWKTANLRQLWRDILGVAAEGPRATHFMGPVVLAPSPSTTPAGVAVWLVVDGQQRLTTLSILLCAIRDHVRNSDERLANKINDLYLLNPYATGQERYTLLPTRTDRATWTGLVEGSPIGNGSQGIDAAYAYFRSEIAAAEGAEIPVAPSRVEQIITGQLGIVEIAAHPDDDVYQIFESLNHTGLRLTQADLLRNYLFMRLPTRADHIYDWQWFPMQSLIGEHLEDLIWLDLVIRGDSKATKSGIYHAQQRHLSKLPSEHSIAEWIAELHFKAKIFSKILDPEQEADPNLRMALDRLRRWGSDVVHPIALKILIAHAAERMDTDEAIAALRMAESYLVRRMIVGTSSAGSNIISALLVKELGDATPTADAIRRALSGPRRKFPTDQQIRDAAIASPFYWYGRGPQRTYVLRCLEEDYGHEEPPDWEAKFTVEHILPQTINREEWRETLAEDAREGETIDEVHRSLVHTIGNLTLTGSNPKLADREFTEKKKLLMDSGLAMNREIAVSDRWGREEVHNRGRMLAERITRIWPGPEDQAAIAPSPTLDWPILTQVLSSIPAGRWTSYSDVAEVVGTSAHVVGRWLPSRAVPNAHRVLMLNGSIPSSIRWPDPQRTDDPRTVLQQEGVTLEASGRAVAHLRMSSSDLARACDMYTPDDEDNSNREFLLFDS